MPTEISNQPFEVGKFGFIFGLKFTVYYVLTVSHTSGSNQYFQMIFPGITALVLF